MKAVICREFGPPASLVVEDLPSPQPGPGEVLVSVKAASVNFPDVLIIQNKYQVKPPLPFSPGSELAGVVERVGDGVDHLAPGDRVMGMIPYGAFREQVVADARNLVPIPDGMDFTTASAFTMTYVTSDHALTDRAALAHGETLVVLGAAGGVGLAAVEIGRALGAQVIACASTDAKLEICRQHGANDLVNYEREDLRQSLRRLTADRGVDVVYDAVGGRFTEPALRSTAWRGRLLVVGFAAGEIPKIPLNLTLLKGCSIVGVFVGEFLRREPERFAASVQRLGSWFQEGKLRPHVSKTFPLERAPEAIAELGARHAAGKIVVLTGGGVL